MWTCACVVLFVWGFFSLNNCYKKPLRQELFKCRAGRLVVSGGHPHNRAVMVCTFQEFLTDEWHVANFSADHMYSTVFITQSSIFSPISYLVFALSPKYVAWSSNYIVRYQLEIMLQQTITIQFDLPFSTVNINCWHCFSRYHLHCLSDSSTTHQFDISIVPIQKKHWKRPAVILKSALRSPYCVHVELEQKRCEEKHSWRQVWSKHPVPSSHSRNSCGKHWNNRLCRQDYWHILWKEGKIVWLGCLSPLSK